MKYRLLVATAALAVAACAPGFQLPSGQPPTTSASKSPNGSASPKASTSPSTGASASPDASGSAAPVVGPYSVKIDGTAIGLASVRRSPLADTIIQFGATDGEYQKDQTATGFRVTTYMTTNRLFSRDFTRNEVTRIQLQFIGTDKKYNVTKDFRTLEGVTAEEVSVSRSGDQVTFHVNTKLAGISGGSGAEVQVEFDAVVPGADIATKPTTP